MCQATPPAGASSNPTSRGPGNGIGAIGSVNYADGPAATPNPSDRGPGNSVGATPATSATPSGVPLGANAGLAATQAVDPTAGTRSFAEQGHSGVGTPLGVPYNTTPATGGGMAGITGPRMMDTGSLFGSAVPALNNPNSGVGLPTPEGGPIGPWTPGTPNYTGPVTSPPGGSPTYNAANPDATSDPFILRDQMYGLNPTPVDNVSNALMRRFRSYYR